MAVSLGPGKRFSVEEFVLLGIKPNVFVLEESTISKLDENYNSFLKEKKIFDQLYTNVTDMPQNSSFSVQEIRLGLLFRILSLFSYKSPVKAVTVKHLVELLNHNITPLFSSVSQAGAELLSFLFGQGYALDQNNKVIPAAEALSIMGVGSLVVSEIEKDSFLEHPFLSLGSAVFLAYKAGNLIKIIDPIAALSCEAIGCNFDAFDSTLYEIYRQHRGQMLSANNLKVLLEGSKRSGASSADNQGPFYNIPSVVGPCQEIIAVATKALEIELNSSEIVPLKPESGLNYDNTQIYVALDSIKNALKSLALSSNDRFLLVSQGSYDNQQSSESSFQECLSSLSQELSASLLKLQVYENELSTKKADKQENSEKALEKGKPQNDDSNLTPEQRAKAEAKRKAKAEKAAAKAAAKEQRKSGLVLGAGTSQIRSLVLNKLLVSWNEDTIFDEITLFPTISSSIYKLLDIAELTEDTMVAEIAKVLEQLNTGGKRKPKIAKGARDFTPEQMRIREQAFNAIRKVFKRHGGVEIDTPVFELKEVLTGKYGEDSKLIYDLADQGGELLSLRYDLTVPFARFLAMNSVGNIKRYHIAKVYRRDNPQLARGRYREFYQCDFDIAGNYSPMVPDAEVITVATEILSDLPVGSFMIKLNHRKLLDAIFEICGVPAEKFRPICSAVDKLDKLPWEEVRAEMVNEKGLAAESADKIANFVLRNGNPFELWDQLMTEGVFGDHISANEAMRDLKLLFQYLEAMGSLPYISFDLSLARGLDYYTGVIYEAVLTDGTSQVGSIAAGGRYDNLVGMFSTSGVQTPCVGVSIGIERVFTIMEKKAEQLNLLQAANIQVFIASIGPNLMTERMKIAQKLWKSNISSEYSHLDNPKFKKQLDDTLERGIPYMVVFGQDELDKNIVKVKDMKNHTEEEVSIDLLVQKLESIGCIPLNAGLDLSFIQAMKASQSN